LYHPMLKHIFKHSMEKILLDPALGKLLSTEAEWLLDDVGVKQNSKLSRKVLKQYFSEPHISLLECLLRHNLRSNESNKNDEILGSTQQRSTLNAIYNSDIHGADSTNKVVPGAVNSNVDIQILAISKEMERSKQAQLKLEIQK